MDFSFNSEAEIVFDAKHLLCVVTIPVGSANGRATAALPDNMNPSRAACNLHVSHSPDNGVKKELAFLKDLVELKAQNAG